MFTVIVFCSIIECILPNHIVLYKPIKQEDGVDYQDETENVAGYPELFKEDSYNRDLLVTGEKLAIESTGILNLLSKPTF